MYCYGARVCGISHRLPAAPDGIQASQKEPGSAHTYELRHACILCTGRSCRLSLIPTRCVLNLRPSLSQEALVDTGSCKFLIMPSSLQFMQTRAHLGHVHCPTTKSVMRFLPHRWHDPGLCVPRWRSYRCMCPTARRRRTPSCMRRTCGC